MPGDTSVSFLSAVHDFWRARRQAGMEEVMARLTGKSADLLSYEEVRKKLRVGPGGVRTLKDIPLDAIVGSVGRYHDFTRSFLPRLDHADRWARVKLAVTSMAGLPPIEVYQIGETYFVRDGHHRVSVARDLEATHIQAYVTEVPSRVPLSPDAEADELILKGEYAGFLQATHFDELRPEADLSVTVPGQYPLIEEHIGVHRYFMGLEQQREIPYEEAVAHWYDTVYLPVVQVIRERTILREFPGRTEADLYLWLAEHRAQLEAELGWQIRPEAAAADLVTRFSRNLQRVVARVREKVLDVVTPDELEAGPGTGQWRRERFEGRHHERLFSDILVAVNGEEAGWQALEQALEVARREGAQLHGLHVLPSEVQAQSEEALALWNRSNDTAASIKTPYSTGLALQAEFSRRCQAAGVSGRLALEVGKVPRKICERAAWTDLVVLSLTYPPAPQLMARLGSGLRTVILRCSRPLLVVPTSASSLSRALLAYDGSPKADEALFVATYVAGSWAIPLVVVTVMEGDRATRQTLARAGEYLESHGVQATCVVESGPVAGAVLRTADEHQSDLIIMGGYGSSPVLEVVLGSAVDQVLRASRRPMLICR